MIVNPIDNIKYSIYSNNGRKILKNYIYFYKTGGTRLELEPLRHDSFLPQNIRNLPELNSKSDFSDDL